MPRLPQDDPIAALDTRIQKAKAEQQEEEAVNRQNPLNAGRIISELVAGIVVGMLMGYYADEWLETSPVFFIICTFFGLAAGVLNIYKQVPKEAGDNDSGSEN